MFSLLQLIRNLGQASVGASSIFISARSAAYRYRPDELIANFNG